MTTVLPCPGCGAGMETRRGLRLHLLSHGFAWNETFAVAMDVARTRAPPTWRCKSCSRKFATVRGLCIHTRSTGHGAFPVLPRLPAPTQVIA